MRSTWRHVTNVAIATCAGFIAGIVVMALLLSGQPRVSAAAQPRDDCGTPTLVAPPPLAAPAADVPNAAVANAVAAATPDPPVRSAVPELGADPIGFLKSHHLLVPVSNVRPGDLVRSFADKRSGNRVHEAIDILAPRRTPVIAVEDGVLVKFFFSDAGGNTIYQFDPSSAYAYYYAHLDGYAAGVKEGDRVKRGQLIGYVGTTGNAPPNTPHLHFAIFKLTEKKQWWKGTPIDPFDVWR
jgi:murein DD-endopeptidase MepM/ murein hydrolase activator NlpD